MAASASAPDFPLYSWARFSRYSIGAHRRGGSYFAMGRYSPALAEGYFLRREIPFSAEEIRRFGEETLRTGAPPPICPKATRAEKTTFRATGRFPADPPAQALAARMSIGRARARADGERLRDGVQLRDRLPLYGRSGVAARTRISPCRVAGIGAYRMVSNISYISLLVEGE